MTLAPNNAQTLSMVQDNLVRILLMVTQQIANPTQSGIDAIVTAYEAAVVTGSATGIPIPKPTYSLDGVSYQWESYRKSLEESILTVQKLMVTLGGNFLLRSRGTT